MSDASPDQSIVLTNMERLEARESRMIWAAGISNGAVLLGILGLIGNVSNPDEAFSFFTTPIALLGLGVLAGGIAARLYAYAARVGVGVNGAIAMANEADGLARHSITNVKALWMLEDALHLLRTGHPKSQAQRAKVSSREASAEWERIAPEFAPEVDKQWAKVRRSRQGMNWLIVLSIAFLVAAFLDAGIRHQLGQLIQ